ncbi:hypothetical protein WJX81_004203 [Elliptochloris bilobata]|uniref:Methyltransferase FkbM domain-containing protein n=1 Tax=Elliptochloris bilobata TaxID=381761 RepID=A0AAW1RUQ0_9CHLO
MRHSKLKRRTGTRAARITPVLSGAASGTAREADFYHYPGAAGWSTMTPDAAEVEGAMGVYLGNALSRLRGLERSPANHAAAWLQGMLPVPLFEWLWRARVRAMLRRRERHVCKLQTVSAIMAAQGLQRVDLLKVDVERAELDVLNGVAAADWPRIRQLVVEDELLRGSSIFLIYCVRGTAE